MQGFHIRIRFRFLFVWNDAKISSWPPCVTITFGGSTDQRKNLRGKFKN